MSVTFVAAGAIATGGPGNITPAKPAGWAVDDILIVQAQSTDNVTHSYPSGWTKLNQTNSDSNETTSVAWKRAVTSEPDPLITHTAGSSIAGCVSAWRGATGAGGTSSPFSVVGTPVGTSDTPGSKTITATAITPNSGDHVIFVGSAGLDTQAMSITSYNVGNPALTARFELGAAFAIGLFGGSADSTGGATTTNTATMVQTIGSVGQLLAMTPGGPTNYTKTLTATAPFSGFTRVRPWYQNYPMGDKFGGLLLALYWNEAQYKTLTATLPTGDNYASLILADNPVLYWRLGEAAGATVAVDSSGNGNNGSYSISADPVTSLLKADPYNTGETFGGSMQYIDGPDLTVTNGVSALTVEAWIKPTAVNVLENICSRWNFQDGGQSFMWDIDEINPGDMGVQISSGPKATQIVLASTAGGLLVAGTTYHVAFVFDGTGATNAARFKIYVNGVSQTLSFGSSTVPTALQSLMPVNFQVGLENGFYTGAMDEIAVYTKALSGAAIARRYAMGSGARPLVLQTQRPIPAYLDLTGPATSFVNPTSQDGSAASVTTTVPAGVANGDALIAVLGTAVSGVSPPTITAPSGWSFQARQSTGGDPGGGFQTWTIDIYTHVAASEPASYDWSNDLGQMWGAISAYRGVDPTVVNVKAGSSHFGAGSFSNSAVTTTANKVIVVACCIGNNLQNSGAPSNMTSRVGGLSTHGLGIADATQALPGTFTPNAWPVSSTNYAAWETVALQPKTAVLTKQTSRLRTATLSFVGTAVKQTQKALAATLSFLGSVATVFTPGYIQAALFATLSFVGTVTKQTTHVMPATLSFIGTVTKFTRRSLAATLSFVGTTLKQTNRVLAAVLALVATGGYRTVVLASSPVAYWRLGESTGTAAADETGHANGTYTGTDIGQPSLLTYDGDLSMLGGTTYVSFPSNAFTDFIGNVSTEFWVQKSSAPSQSFAVWIEKEIGGGTPSGWQVSGGGTSIPRLYIKDGTGFDSGTLSQTSGQIWDGVAHHIVFTYDGANVRSYFDGAISLTTPVTRVMASTAGTSGYIANGVDAAGQEFNGYIDEPAIYSTVLSAFEIKNHYNAGTLHGALAKQTRRTLTAALSFIGALPRRTSRALTATLPLVGAVTKFTSTARTATLSFVGTVTKQTNRALAGVLSFVGTAILLRGKLLTATLSFVGSITKQTTHAMPATLALIGAITKRTARALAAVFRPKATGGTLYTTEVNADSPIGYWRLDDASGTTVHATAGPDGTYGSTGVTLGNTGGTGDGDAAATFDGSSGYFSAPLNLSARTAVTVEFLLKTASYPGVDQLAMEYTTNYNGSNGGFIINPNSPSVIEMAMRDSDGYRSLFVGSRPSTGAWHHWVVAFDKASAGGIAITAWIDNVKSTASFSASPTTTFDNATLYGASRAGSSLFFASDMDEVAVYSGVLSDARVTAHYNAIANSPGGLFKQTRRLLAGVLSFVGTLNLIKAFGVALAGVLSFTTTITRRTTHVMPATLALIGTTTRAITLHAYTATLSFVGTLTKQTRRALAATLSFIGTLAAARQFFRTLVATLLFVGGVTKQTGKLATGTLPLIGTATRQTGHVMTATLVLVGSIVKRAVTRGLTATLALAGNVFKQFAKIPFLATLSFVGTSIFIRVTLKLQALFATVAFSGTVLFGRQKLFVAILGLTGQVNRSTSRVLTATLSFVGTLIRLFRYGRLIIGATTYRTYLQASTYETTVLVGRTGYRRVS